MANVPGAGPGQASPEFAQPRRRSLIANPVPVGVAGFALTTFTLGLYTTGQFHPEGEVVVLALAVFYGGLVQLIAGFFALAKGELFAASFMTSYGAFWLSYVALILFVVPSAGPGTHQAVTIFLIMWTVITIIFTLATLGTNATVLVTFIVFVVALLLEVIGNAMLTGAEVANSVTKAGGYAELVLATLAWYIVMAEIVNDVLGRTVFPLFPFRRDEPAAAPPERQM
jgi:succinate-acetate transporter protein